MTDDNIDSAEAPRPTDADSGRLATGASIAEIRELVAAGQKVQILRAWDPISQTMFPVVRNGDAIEKLPIELADDYLGRPRFRAGTATFTALDSFIDHANRFSSPESALFANDDRKNPSITSVLDYHPRGADTYPDFGRHRGEHAFPLSDEWQAWMGANGQKMPMIEFAAFLENRIVDVLPYTGDDDLPEDLRKFIKLAGGASAVASPERLVELSRGLTVNESSVLTSVINLSTGEGELMFRSEHADAAGEKLKVPSVFLLAIPVFRHDAAYRIGARLRYRKSSAGLLFFFELYRADFVFDDAFRRGCERAAAETELPLFFGSPE